MNQPLASAALDQLFLEARTFSANPNPWLDRAVPDALLQQIWALARMGPTAANMSPMRVVFVRSAAAKARLLPTLDEGNRAKTMAAPVTAIVAMDMAFYEQLPKLYPHADARSWFAHLSAAELLPVALRNGSLQGAYLLLAARALGLDCGPMSGFNNAALDQEFFADSALRSNFLVNLGYGDRRGLHPRSPRLDFAEACQIV
ncbi:MAG: malonic semialdehyde reductase [Lysobacterales bacterium CG02_land_8_20_14_3_00_62_12]|nr:MAG: malonic semialdehyde reductase [Xanthomonadales bacterium CG02_land_8_20_14_3_00_62_12]PJA37228.1 MAG: malonic semialdehyde reductase [Xanthomonadales bacterium CG_4_9_14_3_um_filter_62_6]